MVAEYRIVVVAMEDGNESASVRCRFVTALPDIRVTSDPFSVPVRLGRKGLSDVSIALTTSR